MSEPTVSAMRTVDGKIVIGKVERIDANMLCVWAPVEFAFVRPPGQGLLPGTPPKPIPAMTPYCTLPHMGIPLEKLMLYEQQIIGVPEEITDEELIALYEKALVNASRVKA